MVLSFDDPNICWTVWKSFFNEIFHKHAPLRQKRVRSNPVPWITPIIKQTMRNRNFHKKRAIKCNSRYHWQKYKNWRNRVNREMKLSKSQLYYSENCAISGNIKKTWFSMNISSIQALEFSDHKLTNSKEFSDHELTNNNNQLISRKILHSIFRKLVLNM